ncbi:hypothetical protein [Halostagnicola sp. A-GB9-2]|uniref:hypothetical protein n=1 Tax=Halostagnicola sp. A-GB9-2 TaxID=3048066 RepID=UPI0024BF2C8A|nr:hypothetical protein [Halostagnicola sp. A-GB9-2]MDJ1430507.1 hypothetical protein [Halostagnicola sp. A-GB9-2]
MSDVIHSPLQSDRSLLAVSFALFAAAGGIGATSDEILPTVAGTALAVGGVYAVARVATVVSRRRLATLSFGFWSSFLGVATLHIVGVGTISTVLPGSTTLAAITVGALTWGTLLLACATSVFLGFREYGATPGTEAADDRVVENDSDYSVR